MAFSAGMIGAATHLVSGTVAGARNALATPDGAASPTRGLDTFFASADRLMNGTSGSGNGMLASVLKSTLVSTATALGIGSLGQASTPTLSWQTQVKDSFLQGLLADARSQQQEALTQWQAARGTAREQQAYQHLQQANEKVDSLSVTRLQMVADSRQQDLAALTATLTAQMPDAQRIPSFLDGDLDPLTYRPKAGDEPAFAQRLMADLSIGVARLDYLDARIRVLDYQIQQGMASPEAKATLAQLQSEYDTLSQRIAKLRTAGLNDLADKVEERERLRTEYAQTEQRVINVTRAIEQATGRSIVDDTPIDWTTLSTDETRAHLRAVGDKVRAENRTAIDTGDATWMRSRADQLADALLRILERDSRRDERRAQERDAHREQVRNDDTAAAERRAWWNSHIDRSDQRNLQRKVEFEQAHAQRRA